MNKLGSVLVGGSNPTRIMGILNTSPESFYKQSIKTTKNQISARICQMEQQGADIIDIGGMSTAPYLSTMISQKEESRRLSNAIKIIQTVSNLPISADVCRADVARDVLELGVEIINDVTGLKYDKKMLKVIRNYEPSLILCAHSQKSILGKLYEIKHLFKESILLAKSAGVPVDKIVLDPAIGFFRNSGTGPFFTKIRSDWIRWDLGILQHLQSLKQNFPMLVSVSRKSFLGAILDKDNPKDRIASSLACEVLSIIRGADIIRTHDIQESKHIATIVKKLHTKSL